MPKYESEDGKDEDVKKEVESWTEISEFRQIVDNIFVLSNKNVGKIKVPGDKIAICDLCNCETGPFRDIKPENIIQPETMSRAIKEGLKPMGNSLKLAYKLGNDKANEVIYAWREMSLRSETPWNLCDNCLQELNKYLTK